MNKFLTILIINLCFAGNLYAQEQCADKGYQQFDFWLGEWQVSNSQNSQTSRSKISKILNGCVILEEYTAESGYQGKSLNIYNNKSQQWHQTWTDNDGLMLQLDGRLINGSMVLMGTVTNAQGDPLLQRITWTPLAAGDVRQHWQQSTDNGTTWTTLFDGHYRKK